MNNLDKITPFVKVEGVDYRFTDYRFTDVVADIATGYGVTTVTESPYTVEPAHVVENLASSNGLFMSNKGANMKIELQDATTSATNTPSIKFFPLQDDPSASSPTFRNTKSEQTPLLRHPTRCSTRQRLFKCYEPGKPSFTLPPIPPKFFTQRSSPEYTPRTLLPSPEYTSRISPSPSLGSSRVPSSSSKTMKRKKPYKERGFACASVPKPTIDLVPKDHIGPVPGISVGFTCMMRRDFASLGVHRYGKLRYKLAQFHM